MSSHKRGAGFTLIEMSLVLVIIGLVVGGMMGIQAYSKTASYNMMINQAKYYMSAYNQFSERYQYPPGDVPTATSIWSGVSTNGDGNGIINNPSNGTPETFLTFQQLSKAGLIDGNYTGAGVGGTLYAVAGVNVPSTAVKNTALYISSPSTPDGYIYAGSGITYDTNRYFDGMYSHFIVLAGLLITTNNVPGSTFLVPEAAFGLDSKFDDGVPNQGWFMTPNQTGNPSCTTGTSPVLYRTSYKTVACYLVLRIQ